MLLTSGCHSSHGGGGSKSDELVLHSCCVVWDVGLASVVCMKDVVVVRKVMVLERV